MFESIHHAMRVVSSSIRERSKRKKRSPQWPRVEKVVLIQRPACEACGGIVRRQVHHKKPFHLYPELELDTNNLIVLCMGPKECHIRIGHGDDFKAFNPNVVRDAVTVLDRDELRPGIEKEAKKNRQYE